MDVERRGQGHLDVFVRATGDRVPRRRRVGKSGPSGKSFEIPKQLVWEDVEVAANKGAAGVDGVPVAEFETDLKNDLYRIWNPMSSGRYFPPPVDVSVETEASRGLGQGFSGNRP